MRLDNYVSIWAMSIRKDEQKDALKLNAIRDATPKNTVDQGSQASVKEAEFHISKKRHDAARSLCHHH